MRSVFFILLFITLAFTVQGYGLGCAPANNNQDCENPQTQTCTKILIGTTAKVKALGKYYYQCLPREWATQAVQAAQAHVLDATPLEKVAEKKSEEVKTEQVAEKVQSVVPVQETPVAQAPTTETPTEEEETEEKEEQVLDDEQTESVEEEEDE